MLWKPEPPICSSITDCFNVYNFKADVSFDFVNGDIMLDNNGSPILISGLENFIQRVKKFVLTPKTEWCKYGFKHNLWEVENQSDFEKECLSLALQMVNQTSNSSSDGLGACIEKITQMNCYDTDGYRHLAISMFVTGKSSEIIVIVPKKKS